MRYSIIILFIIVHLLWGIEVGYSSHSAIYTHFTYSFQHVSWIHLFFNSIGLISLYNVLEKVFSKFVLLAYSYSIAVLASFLSKRDLPTVGSSGVIYAMIGLFLATSLIGKKLKIVDHKKFLSYIICIGASLLLSAVKENVNNVCHISALALGSIAGMLDSLFKKN